MITVRPCYSGPTTIADVMMLGFNMMYCAHCGASADDGSRYRYVDTVTVPVYVPADCRRPDRTCTMDKARLVLTPRSPGFCARRRCRKRHRRTYRYVRHEPGADVVLFGTSQIEHLESNIASILKPPLPPEDTAMLAELFGHLQGVGLDLPGPV